MAERLEMVVIRLPKQTADRAIQRSREFELASDDEIPGARAAATDARHDALASIKLEKDELSAEDTARIASQDDVLDVVPSVPFSLPGPVRGASANATTDLSASWGIAAVGAADASTTAGTNVVVAVLDSGIFDSHPAFHGLEIELKNFTDEPGDVIGHGTHTAATIFGRDVGGVRIGIARGVKKALIGKVLSRSATCTTDVMIDAIMWALLGKAHIINMSLGIDFPRFQKELMELKGYPPVKATSIALAGYRMNIRVFDRLSSLLAIDDRGFSGGLVIAAAGNESLRPDYTITTSPPAAGDHFISVAAVDQALNVALFSNDDVDIAAPGLDILSASLDGKLRLDSGTSMAAPHVAGVAVLYADALISGPSFSTSALDEKLRTTAKPCRGRGATWASGLCSGRCRHECDVAQSTGWCGRYFREPPTLSTALSGARLL